MHRIDRGKIAAVYCNETGGQDGTDDAVAESNTSFTFFQERGLHVLTVIDHVNHWMASLLKVFA